MPPIAISVDYEALALFIGGAGLFTAVLTWWIGRLLADRKDSAVHDTKIKHLEQRVNRIEIELREIRRK